MKWANEYMRFPLFLISPVDAWARSRLERAYVAIKREWKIKGKSYV